MGKALGLSPLVIGVFLVGLGTSLPEFFVSHLGALRGSNGIALGNIIGSNLSNIFLILGITGLVSSLNVKGKDMVMQVYLHLLLTVILAILFIFDRLYFVSSLVLFTFFLYYVLQTYLDMKKHHKKGGELDKNTSFLELSNRTRLVLAVKLFFGFFLLYLGGELLVENGKAICTEFGISEFIVSAIFVAFGTSFPELVTSLLACYKKKDTDLILGNLIGSNIFNVAFVLGTMGGYNIGFDRSFKVELGFLLLAATLLIIIQRFKETFGKVEGAIFLSCYIAVVVYWVSNIKS